MKKHKASKETMERLGMWGNKAIPGTKLRPDAIDFQKRIIYELKPNNRKEL